MKLQQGDYVTNLTEEQFEELIGISGSLITWNESKKKASCYISKSVIYNPNMIFHTNKTKATTKLPFEEFKQRAINTFKNENIH